METNVVNRHPVLKDIAGLVVFAICVFIGTIVIQNYIFRSFNVEGPSMEKTLYTNDRLIVNRMPVTLAELQNKPYVPSRGQVIVFKNPQYRGDDVDEFIVKRVIGLPGEHVVLKDGKYTVYNKEHPQGFNPDDNNHGEPGSPTSGTVDTIVTDDHLFVSGDHRQGTFSYDSRNGLGQIPFYDVVGPVGMRIYPFNAIRTF